MSKNQVYEYKSVQNTEMVITHLEEILEGLKSGGLLLGPEDNHCELHPTTQTKFSIEVKEGEEVQSLKLKLKWKNEPAGETWESGAFEIGNPQSS